MSSGRPEAWRTIQSGWAVATSDDGAATKGASIPFRVYLDGEVADGVVGTDVGADGRGTVDAQRTYQLIRQSGQIDDRRFEIEFLDAGVEAYCFTFG